MSKENLKARIANLEDRLETIEGGTSVEDDSGTEWSINDLIELGLTRRQALKSLGALALYGGSIWGAVRVASQNAEAATDQVGTSSKRVDLFADSVDSNSINTEELNSTPYRIPSGGSIIFEGSVSNLISNLSTGDYAFIPSGNYDPITISTDEVTVICGSVDGTRFSSSDGDAVTITGDRVVMENFTSTASGTNGEHGVVIDGTDCYVGKVDFRDPDGNHIRFKSNATRSVAENLYRAAGAGGDSIVFENGSSDNIVNNYTNAGTITDNDGSNATGTTT